MANPTKSQSSSSSSSSSSKRRWTKSISTISARIFFLLIIFQIPLFRVTCRSGMCTSPLHVTSSQLIASEVFPVPVVKALLYPGAALNGLIHNFTLPKWDHLLDLYNLTNAKEASAVTDLQRLEVLAGSYFTVAGALVGLVKPGRMSMFGNLLVIWGLVKEGILGKPVTTDPSKAVYVYPTMVIAVICAFSSVKYDAKKVARSAPIRSSAKPLQGSSKSKLK
ncbi:hypothetical protein Lal_00004900 [Lupinus albus]|uniref:Uncharacterized protein n=1 Tax=Lupinus albus TaxID=3870 RepID=A0A6A4NK98_LUPAL|nr:hypothetical protein Lalb_Chr23g0268741 [Lupinus albus]KAF1865524.1 hypothetical protein Lal_00004900 [Lupinus albus]